MENRRELARSEEKQTNEPLCSRIQRIARRSRVAEVGPKVCAECELRLRKAEVVKAQHKPEDYRVPDFLFVGVAGRWCRTST